MSTARDLCTAALLELGVYGPTDTPAAEDLGYALNKLNRLLDNWNADRRLVYTTDFVTFTLTPNRQPHTIGPSGADYTVTQRPVAVDGGNIVLTDVTPNVRTPLAMRDDAWWLDQRVRDVSSTVPTDLFYSPDFPTGNIYLWPVPETAYDLELMIRMVLAQVTLATTIAVPPGYYDALVKSLAEDLLVAYPRVSIAPQIALAASTARARIARNNDVTPSLSATDFGVPGRARRSGGFNYLTGSVTGR